MSPDIQQPTVESLLEDIRRLYKALEDRDSKIRAIEEHLGIYLQDEVVMKRYKAVKRNIDTATACAQSLRGL